MKKMLLPILILIFNVTNSQTADEKINIVNSYDQKKINKYKQKLVKENQQHEERLNEYFKTGKIGEKRFKKDGFLYEVIDVLQDGTILYYTTANQGGSQTIKANSLNTGGDLGLDVNGESMIVGVWDGGIARLTHNEFPNSKVISYDGSTSEDLHPTHVTGTIAAVGLSPSLSGGGKVFAKGYSKGIAPAASIYASDWTNDIQEMMKFAGEGNLVSNHSYSYAAIKDGQSVLPVGYFGAYEGGAYNSDLLSSLYPKYQIVVSAGNNRRDYSVINPTKGGYELITGQGNSKNTLTVSAVEEVLNYTQPSDVVMSDFSNYGPTDDGRIKPNISAKGVLLLSPGYDATNSPDSNNGYYLMSGTSMSAPTITGAIALLQQHFNNLNGKYMESATVRGLLQHTAMEAGNSDGPDYSFGWGLADLKTAAIAISNNKNNGSIIEENILENQATYTKTITASETEPLIVSISWTELPSPLYNKNGTEDPDVLYLVNDLDVRVTDESGTVYYPWKLDGKNPSVAATKGDNIVDNFERIDIPNPSGKYTITVSHKGNLVEDYDSADKPINGPQNYTLIITGGDASLGTEDIDKSSIFSTKIYPVPAKNTVTVSVKQATNYTIFGLEGKQLLTGKLVSGNNTLDISGLTQGVYIIKLESNSKIETRKIIVQ